MFGFVQECLIKDSYMYCFKPSLESVHGTFDSQVARKYAIAVHLIPR